MTVLMIDGRRDCYSGSDLIGKTMTVMELRSYISCYDDDTPIMICNDNGYTYGKITGASIREEEIEED